MNYDVAILTRNPQVNLCINQYFWDPSKFLIDEDTIDIDCIVHLTLGLLSLIIGGQRNKSR